MDLNDKNKFLFFSYELLPFCKINENIELLTLLINKTIEDNGGQEVRIILPRFGLINERRNRLHEVKRLSGSSVEVDSIEYTSIIKVASLPQSKFQAYFLDSEDYFKNKVYFRNAKDVFLRNNDERMIYFCKGSLDMLKKLGWVPDYILCYGWFSSLVPLYFNKYFSKEPGFNNTTVRFVVPDDSFPEKLNNKFINKILDDKRIDSSDLDNYGLYYKDLLKGAISYSDSVIFLSNAPDKELVEFSKECNKEIIMMNEESLTKESDKTKLEKSPV